MKRRTIAIASSIAALSFAAAPIAQAASSAHPSRHAGSESLVDRSRDASGVRHADRSTDERGADIQRDSLDF
jgi:hypothetical protein